MDKVLDKLSWSALFQGIGYTLAATVAGAVLAFVLAFLFGILARSRHVGVRAVVRVIVEFFRGTSLYVQLFWFFYALPELGFQITGFNIGPVPVPSGLLAGILAVGLNFGAYGSEVVRGAINAVPKAQWEGAVALNMSAYQRMRLVILPQAWVGMIPPFNNLIIQLLKSTPLLSLVTVPDLMGFGQQLRDDSGQSDIVFLGVMVVYFVIAYLFTLGMNALEASAAAKLGRGHGLRGIFRLRAADATGRTAGAGGGGV